VFRCQAIDIPLLCFRQLSNLSQQLQTLELFRGVQRGGKQVITQVITAGLHGFDVHDQ